MTGIDQGNRTFRVALWPSSATTLNIFTGLLLLSAICLPFEKELRHCLISIGRGAILDNGAVVGIGDVIQWV